MGISGGFEFSNWGEDDLLVRHAKHFQMAGYH